MKVTEAELQSTKRRENCGWLQRDSAEHEEYAGALIGGRIAENNILSSVLTNQRLEKDGFTFFHSYYKSVTA